MLNFETIFTAHENEILDFFNEQIEDIDEAYNEYDNFVTEMLMLNLATVTELKIEVARYSCNYCIDFEEIAEIIFG